MFKMLVLFIFGLILLLTGACSAASPTATPGLSEQDVAATVNAAVQATGTAEAGLAATVNAAVQATGAAAPAPTALPPTLRAEASTEAQPEGPQDEAEAPPPTPPSEVPTVSVPTALPPQPTPNVTTMSEEELAAAIDAAVAEALAAADAATTTSADAASDGALTVEETLAIEVTLTNAQEAIALAEELIALYDQVYGAYAEEALAILLAMEADLQAIYDDLDAVLVLIEQGAEAATAAWAQIEAALQAADENIAAIQEQAQGWLEALQVELESRSAEALAVQATQIAANRAEALQSAQLYAETLRATLADYSVSQSELAALAQAGANAVAGLQAYGGPQLQGLADSINAMTAQVATGQWPQVQISLSAFEAALPSRP